MRSIPFFVVAISALGLAGCEGASSESPALVACGLNCPAPPDDGGGNDTTGGGGGDDGGGNNTSLSSGDTTIALETGTLVSPQGGSLSKLTVNNGQKTAKFVIDTKAPTNGTWPVAEDMEEYEPGSNAPNFFASPTNLDATAYHEYRNISATGGGRDEVLQVWNWDDSYATQYRNVGSSGEASQQAFSFGGTKTALAEMPKSASATYQGSYGSTAKASNWITPDPTLSPNFVVERNNLFQTNGSATITADFGAQTVNGTLAPQHWKFVQDAAQYHYEVATNNIYRNDGTLVDSNANAPGFFSTPILLSGSISGNTYSGKARLGGGFVSGDNPMFGAFFGSNAHETTGAFAVRGVSPGPIGGEYPINDDRRGFLNHSGIFHGTCQPGGACTP